MKVNLQRDADAEPYATNVELADCFPDEPEEAAWYAETIEKCGSAWAGGGAGQAVFIALASPPDAQQLKAGE